MKEKRLIIIKYLALFFVYMVFANAQIGNLSPFVYALFFACLFVGVNEKVVAGYTLVSAICVDCCLQNFFVALTIVATGLIVFYAHLLFKLKFKIITFFITMPCSFVTYFYYNSADWVTCVMFALLSLVCLWVFIRVLHILLLRKNCFKITLNEAICCLFALAVIGLGIAPIFILNFKVYALLLALIIFVFIAVGNTALTTTITLAFTFGVAIYEGSLTPVAFFTLIAFLAGMFRMPQKTYMVLTAMIVNLFLKLFFEGDLYLALYSTIPITVAGIVFLLIPNKKLNAFADKIYTQKSEIASRNVINTTRKNLKKRMVDLSNVFLEMQQIHLSMVKKELTKEELISMLKREILKTCCCDCIDKLKCTRSLGTDNKSNLEMLIEIAVTKGKLTLLDLPEGLTNRCGKINSLINLINRLCDEYRQYKNIMADVNNVKVLLADQMGAVSRMLINLGAEIDNNVTFDLAKENKIISRLLAQNIECKEVLLYTEKQDETTAVCLAKITPAQYSVVEKVVSETLKQSMCVVSAVPDLSGDFFTITLHKKARYDCVFGLASCNKAGNEDCGDCHSIIRLGGNRFMLALCDGMGSGKSANKMSALTLGLIEDFYKAGFDNDVVIESVNKLLAVNNQENYSTLDVCLLDLENNLADFIKVGSPFGVVRRPDKIEIVQGGALPIGALDSITPAITKTTISTKDIVVMATDGIMDAFETQENFVDYISCLACNNPQTLAENILNEALRLNNNSAKDDMTILVARTYLKS